MRSADPTTTPARRSRFALTRSVLQATPLEEHRVAPDTVQLRDAAVHGQGLVPGLVVQRDAGSVLRKDRGLQRPQTSGLVGRVSLGDLAGLHLVVRQAVLDLED